MGLLLPPPNPPVLSLFSASLFPHPTWASRTDRALPDDSLIVVLPSTEPLPAGLVHRTMPGRDITHPTVHIQSPTIPTTSLRCPPSRAEMLGVELDWLNLHLARLGGRELALECTLRDGNGVEGRVRCGTFTNEAHITYSTGRPPLLHLPLRFPASSSTSAPVLTSWSHISLSLSSLLNYFSSPLLTFDTADRSRRPLAPLPDARASRGANWVAVEVFANCRLRRVWFSSERQTGTPERGMEELALFASEAPAGEGEG